MLQGPISDFENERANLDQYLVGQLEDTIRRL